MVERLCALAIQSGHSTAGKRRCSFPSRRRNRGGTMFKSIGAVLAGCVTSIALALLTDFIVETSGLLPAGPLHDVRQGFIELGYRCLFTVLAGFITAWLAPSLPLLHTGVLGGVNLLITIAGSV